MHGKILWCDDDAGRELTYSNMRRQMNGSLEDKEFPRLRCVREENCFFEFGSNEDHFKYRGSVKKAYPKGVFPVFRGYNHIKYQIRDPHSFAEMLDYIIRNNRMPDLPFLEGGKAE